MSNNPMKIALSWQAADARWGDKALLTAGADGLLIHLTDNNLLDVIQRAARKVAAQGISQVKLVGEDWDLARSWAFWQGFFAPKVTQSIEWAPLAEAQYQELERRIAIVGWVRKAINLAAEEQSPRQLAEQAAELLIQHGGKAVSYQIIEGEELKRQGYSGLHMVGRSSERPPALLVLDYNPTGDADAPVFAALVGKGITFDSGGYSLKPTTSMESMKADMGGAALISGALALAVAHGLSQRVKLFLCCADNLVSGNAFKLGDIIYYRNGKTVEVINTDAEGRLVLADGLIDAEALQPQLIIDCATLTGAAKTAVGNDYHSVLTFDDQLAADILACASQQNEYFWRLPLAEMHRSQMPSAFADLSNSAGGAHTAGASTAAAFLSHFLDNYQQGWLHIDCSATYRKSAVEGWATGATGVGVLTLAKLLLSYRST